MVNIISSGGRTMNGVFNYVVDDTSDVSTIDVNLCAVGSTVFVIETSKHYMLNSRKEWKSVELGSIGGSSGGAGGAETIIYEGGVV